MTVQHTGSTKRRALLFFALIGVVLLFAKCSPNHFEFEATNFKGKTQQGSLIGLQTYAKEGKIKGKGFHRFSSGKNNEITLKGSINPDGSFTFEEFLVKNGNFFGEVIGTIDEETKMLKGVWTNKDYEDETDISLRVTDLTPEEVLASEPTAYQAGFSNGRNFREKVSGFFAGFKK